MPTPSQPITRRVARHYGSEKVPEVEIGNHVIVNSRRSQHARSFSATAAVKPAAAQRAAHCRCQSDSAQPPPIEANFVGGNKHPESCCQVSVPDFADGLSLGGECTNSGLRTSSKPLEFEKRVSWVSRRGHQRLLILVDHQGIGFLHGQSGVWRIVASVSRR